MIMIRFHQMERQTLTSKGDNEEKIIQMWQEKKELPIFGMIDSPSSFMIGKDFLSIKSKKSKT